MHGWFTKNLGDAMLAGDALEQIKARFLSAQQKADNAGDMALFVRHESEGRLHCEVKLYFTPATVALAAAVGAVPCRKPAVEGLGLVAGTEECWSVLSLESNR